ncbi:MULTISPECIES: enoyl-CoA hydratase/isomerase family protein [Prauserella salsuginis group]|uniref:Enoyl-CoA hydratase/carnithine racemase n=2 Tax=Prauserella salsuginis group TaxID=2893672 RepID=A0A839XZP0_9PSEU|nr:MULTISPECIES: enoyl-CoA hydratase/isomerase family protein [Prauserella salsuginis group]MBB3665185.1 enoyl-CoA hydratase/carnithine racemase [Prauserella sediminis]MCR3718649.1 enoyl-CoA hydratase [Prauserella flava]MCR3733219.1 enoyl-CoA hydratase [Prauserella salsuginis]
MAAELTRFERTEPRSGVVVLTMSRPEKLNAMDQSWFRELHDVMGTFGHGDEAHVRAVVLTGSGRAFSAGGDIDMFAGLDGDVARVRPHLRLVYDAFHAVERCAVPVIAAVNGLAYGGGTELALASDVVLAGGSARFAFKEPTVGLMPGYGIVRGPDVIGRHWTRYLALSGRDIGAERAERIGLVQEVYPDDELNEQAVALAAEMAAHPPLAVQVGKAFVNRDTDGGFAESVEATALLFDTDDHRTAVRTFRAARGR